MELSQDNTAIESAIKAVGSSSELARRLKVTPQAVWLWRKGGAVSPKHAIEIEALTEGAVSKNLLRPDLWPLAESAA